MASSSTRARRCWRCTSATCAASSGRTARGRSRRCATSATGCAPPVASRLVPRGLRAQLAGAIALVTTVALALSFLAVYRGTGARLREGIDDDLVAQAAEWEQLRATAAPASADEREQLAQRFVDSRSYHPAS